MRINIPAYCLIAILSCSLYAQPSGNALLQKGWELLVKDQDDDAFRYFWKAYEHAKQAKNTEDTAESLLYLGICSYGSSREKGLQYAVQSLGAYKKLEALDLRKATTGRSKCLQLISTIYSRQGKFAESAKMSRKVIRALKHSTDRTGTLGLAYSTLGNFHQRNRENDSAKWYFKSAFATFLKYKNYAYLPTAYIKLGETAAISNAMDYFRKGLEMADSSGNQQAKVTCLLTIGKWNMQNSNLSEAEHNFRTARQAAAGLSDKMFEIKAIDELSGLKFRQEDYAAAVRLQTDLIQLKDAYYSLEREQIAKSLEVRFEVAEKDRELILISKQKETAAKANYLLAGCIVLLVAVFATAYFFFRRLNKRDREIQKIKEEQFKNDLEHKESQLSAITLQMLQKNELLEEIKSLTEQEAPISQTRLLKMVDRHLAEGQGWNDFNLYFESVNKNFYTRLKQLAPEIGTNDLKICALIKLNLSIKEMDSILNISPDSVKTARYRLRKKLRMNPEESLTDFIRSV